MHFIDCVDSVSVSGVEVTIVFDDSVVTGVTTIVFAFDAYVMSVVPVLL